jgi:diguanylate cyclase (GGDEF)-like protein/PAS domain S-box-containing protein
MLKHAEANLLALIESTQDLIWSVDLDYRLVTFNKALQQNILDTIGVQLTVGMHFHKLHPPEQAALWPPYYARALSEGPFRVEYSLLDGGTLELAFNPIVVDGKTAGISVFGKDITERKRAESALREAQANHAALIESTEDHIWSVDLNYRLTLFNRAFQQHIEKVYSVSAAVGMHLKDLFQPERLELWLQFLQRALSEGRFRIEYVMLDGRTLYLAINPVVVDGKATGVSVFGEDITERKAAEESRRFLAEVVESCEEAIITNAPSGEILTWNHAAEVIYGYTAGEAVGMPFPMIIAPEIRELAERQLTELLGGAPLLEAQGVALRKDGGRVHVTVSTWPVRNSYSEVTAICTIVRDVSVHYEAEKSRALLAMLVESSGDLIHAVNLDGTIASWNLGAERMTGYTSEEILGKKTEVLVPSRLEGQVRRNLKKLKDGHVVGPFDTVITRKDGTEIDVSLTLSPIRNADGQVVGAAAIARDISQRKQAERALLESLNLLKETQAIGGLGSYVLDIGTGAWTSSDVLDEIFGIGKEYEHTVAGWTTLIHPDDRAMMAAYFAKDVVRKARNFNKEYRIIRQKDQAERWVHGMGRLELGGKGQPVKMRGVIKDITESKLAEMQLHDSEARYRTVFQTSQDAITISRLEDGSFVDVNQAALSLFGFERKEVLGRSSLDLQIWPAPQDRRRFVEMLRRESVCRNIEFQLCKKDGQNLWVLVSGSQMEMDGVPSLLLVLRDITAAKATAEALRTSETRYRSAFQTSLDAIAINRLSDGKYIDCNQAFLDITGFIREEVLAQTSQGLGIWAYSRDRQTMEAMLVQNSSCRRIEVQFRKKNGEVFWGEMSASVMEIEGAPCVLSITRDLSAVKTAEKTIRSLAFYDPLTGLSNRRMLMERLRQPQDSDARRDRSQALLLVDLDHFKTLNDTLGHQTGDLLLQQISRRIFACAHETDTVCRLGGDEFVVVLEDLSKNVEEAAAQAKAEGEKILAAIHQPCMIEDHECHSTASIGIAVFGDRHNNTAEILQQAEIALYQAKAAGRNTLRFFSPALQAAVNARAALEEDLRQAIKEKQFLLYYQPQVERGRLTGAEALIRWKHPKGGLVQPNDFIPLAEETRLILPIGDWVLEDACAQLALWAGRKDAAHLTVAVNISALQFRQPSFVEHVLATLRHTGANPVNLRLELTESMLADNLEDIILKMTELKSHGLRFSLDDFGTGYSSLAYLKRLPLDRLKIDRSFVRDMLVDATSGAIAQTILSLGRAMGISVIAEGVETEEQRGYLTGLGCHSFQGFLFSRPLPLDNFEEFMQGFTEGGGPN